MAAYSTEQLKQVTELASLFFTPAEIALMMEWDSETFIEDYKNEDHPAFKAFHSGRLQSEVDLRKSIIKMAKSGSSPAQTMAMEMLNKSKIKLIGQ